jgi:hypothetical protein
MRYDKDVRVGLFTGTSTKTYQFYRALWRLGPLILTSTRFRKSFVSIRSSETVVLPFDHSMPDVYTLDRIELHV